MTEKFKCKIFWYVVGSKEYVELKRPPSAYRKKFFKLCLHIVQLKKLEGKVFFCLYCWKFLIRLMHISIWNPMSDRRPMLCWFLIYIQICTHFTHFVVWFSSDHVQHSLSNPVLQTILLTSKVLKPAKREIIYQEMLASAQLFRMADSKSDDKR